MHSTVNLLLLNRKIREWRNTVRNAEKSQEFAAMRGTRLHKLCTGATMAILGERWSRTAYREAKDFKASGR